MISHPVAPQPRSPNLDRNPSERYATPHDVLLDPTLDDRDRERILSDWEVDEQRLLESAGENMMGGRHNRLALVHEALRELRARAGDRK